MIVCAISGVVVPGLDSDPWSAVAGVTICSKLTADFILSRHAHPIGLGKKP